MTDLIRVRHGETDWNRIRRFQGQLDVPLNALGQLQSQRLADALDGARRCAIPNAGINRLRWQAGGWQILQWAADDHLAGLPEQPSTDPLTSAGEDPDAIAP